MTVERVAAALCEVAVRQGSHSQPINVINVRDICLSSFYKLCINVAVRRESHFQPIKRTEWFAHLLNYHRVRCASALPAHCQRARLSLESQNFGGPGESSRPLAPWRQIGGMMMG